MSIYSGEWLTYGFDCIEKNKGHTVNECGILGSAFDSCNLW